MKQDELGLNRIIFFSDAVFAIAITLLVVNFKPPKHSGQLPVMPLSHYLVSQLPQYQSYVISFLVIGVYWIGHHHYFRYIERYNFTLVGLNMAFLMCISFLPFPTFILDNYDGQRLAVAFYAGIMTITGLMKTIVWWYASSGHRLVAHHLHRRHINLLTYYTLIPPLVFFGSIGIDIFNPVLAQFSWILIPILFLILRKSKAFSSI